MTGTLNVPSVTVTVTFSPTPTIRKAVKLKVPAIRLALTWLKVTLPEVSPSPTDARRVRAGTDHGTGSRGACLTDARKTSMEMLAGPGDPALRLVIHLLRGRALRPTDHPRILIRRQLCHSTASGPSSLG